LSFILLVGAVLLMQSLQKIRTTSPGFTTSRVLSTKVSLVAAGYDAARSKVFQDQLADRLGSLPGVESVAHARVTPLGYGTYDESPIALDGYEAQPGEQLTVEYNQVSPEYFFTMGIPIVSGREFTRADDENAAPVAVVNETMAARYWRGQNPIGSRLQVKGRWVQVVGMAADSRYESMRETPRPFFYVPLRQDFVRGPNLYLRTSQPLPAMQAAVTREVRALDDNLALYEMITLKEQVDRSTSPQLVAVKVADGQRKRSSTEMQDWAKPGVAVRDHTRLCCFSGDLQVDSRPTLCISQPWRRGPNADTCHLSNPAPIEPCRTNIRAVGNIQRDSPT